VSTKTDSARSFFDTLLPRVLSDFFEVLLSGYFYTAPLIQKRSLHWLDDDHATLSHKSYAVAFRQFETFPNLGR